MDHRPRAGRVHFFENPYAGGPAGAKGIGELPMDGPAPAILNAVEHATGVSFDRVPLTPEAIMDALAPVPSPSRCWYTVAPVSAW